jgi:hypothetical protein
MFPLGEKVLVYTVTLGIEPSDWQLRNRRKLSRAVRRSAGQFFGEGL